MKICWNQHWPSFFCVIQIFNFLENLDPKNTQTELKFNISHIRFLLSTLYARINLFILQFNQLGLWIDYTNWKNGLQAFGIENLFQFFSLIQHVSVCRTYFIFNTLTRWISISCARGKKQMKFVNYFIIFQETKIVCSDIRYWLLLCYGSCLLLIQEFEILLVDG